MHRSWKRCLRKDPKNPPRILDMQDFPIEPLPENSNDLVLSDYEIQAGKETMIQNFFINHFSDWVYYFRYIIIALGLSLFATNVYSMSLLKLSNRSV